MVSDEGKFVLGITLTSFCNFSKVANCSLRDLGEGMTVYTKLVFTEVSEDVDQRLGAFET